MTEPTYNDKEIWGQWNRLREYMNNDHRYEILTLAERKTELACTYLNITDEQGREFMGRYFRNSTIKKAYLNCYTTDLEKNKDWLAKIEITDDGIVFHQKAKTFYCPKESDKHMLEEIARDFRSMYQERKKKGLIK